VSGPAAGEQLGFDGMPRRLFAATPSRLGTFTACPRRYRFTYLLRPTPPKGPPWAHNSLGAAAHNALRDWWLRPAERRTPAAAGGLLDAAWISDGFADAEQSARWRARTRDWVEAYAATLDPADEPVGVERGVAVRTERLALSGRVDRIDARDGELVIVDYKTGRWVPDTDDARGSLALAVYALAAARTLRRPCSRVELHHLPTGRVAGWEHTEASLARHVTRAEHTAEDIEAATGALAGGADPDTVFPPVTGRQCGWCDFRRHCPQGRAASAEQAPWSGLADPAPAPVGGDPADW
jgi:putative RecB family exonuclease